MLPKQIPPTLIVLGVILVVVIIFIQIEIFQLVLARLGLSPASATLLLIITLLGSALNLPLFKIASSFHYEPDNPLHKSLLPYKFSEGHTIIAVNVGGALIPIVFSSYLTVTIDFNLLVVIIAIAVVSTISYLFSRPIANMGIGMPLFVAPVSAAFTAMVLSEENAPALAYICGSIGVVIGADLLRIKDIRQLNTPIASIGGAGTFDGIFMTGIIAVLLTY
ncbi:MAG: DUF1614 domain-containing protein [Thioalkalispiraceae bacterium]|jgi:uncharacterized membrane protein